MAIRRRARDDFRANDRAAAGPVVHQHVLSQQFGQAWRDGACHGVYRTCSGVRYDQAQTARGEDYVLSVSNISPRGQQRKQYGV